MSQPQKNWIDRAANYLSPQWAAKRQMWRDFRATYNGGISTRLNTAWESSVSYAGGTMGDRRLLGNMRDRARRVYRESPIGRSLIDTETDNVIAEGMTLKAKTGDTAFDDEAETRFYEWAEKADIRGMATCGQLQRSIWSRGRIDGDIGVVLVSQGALSYLQIIPGDLIQSPDGKFDQNIVDGVEVDASGRPIAFHLLDTNEFGKRKFARVAAKDFIYLSHTTEPLQTRGETCYATIFELLDQLSGYVDGVVTAARMATIFGLIFRQPDALKAFNGLPTLSNSQGLSQKAVTLENGMVKYVGPEGEVAQVQATQPMQQTPDFVRIMLRLIGLPFSMPLEMVLRDVSQANLSSLRGAKQDFYRACRVKQDVFNERVSSRIYRWWISRAINAGQFTTAPPVDADGNANYWAHEFRARGWQFTDPGTDVSAKLLEIDAGLTSPQRACADLGRYWDEIQKETKEADDQRAGPRLYSQMSREAQPKPLPAPTTQETANAQAD